jgi:hypothetical protein
VAYYEDLSPCDYVARFESPLLAVGWLDRQHPFPTGTVTRDFFESLARLAANPWQPAVAMGRHACEFCAFTGGPAEARMGDLVVKLGVSNVFVPGDAVVYVAPSLVLHYVDAHDYSPPEPFQGAVRACPPMRSVEYLEALRRHGVHG